MPADMPADMPAHDCLLRLILLNTLAGQMCEYLDGHKLTFKKQLGIFV